MSGYKSILLVLNPHNTNKEAFSRATTLAQNSEAKLRLVSISSEGARDTNLSAHEPRPFDMREIACRARQQELQDFLGSLQQAGSDVQCQVLPGVPHREIVRKVVQEKHDLVIATAASATGLSRRTIDRTALHLVRNCPCPVWVFRPKTVVCFTRILAVVDGSIDTVDTQRDALNVKVLDIATSLAQQDKSELHVAQAWTLPEERYLRCGWLPLARELPARLRDKLNAYEDALKSMLRKYDSATANLKLHLPNGEARAAIPPLVRAEQIDLVVLATVRPTGAARFFRSGTAEAVLRHGDSSVLSLGGESHTSPFCPEHSRHALPDKISV